MDKKEMNDSASSRRLLPSLYPGGSRTTTNLPRAGNSHHQQYSCLRPFQHNPAATATAHFASQAGSLSYKQPPPPLFRMTHASTGMGGSSSTVPQDIFFGSGCAGASSSSVSSFCQTPPPPSPAPVAMDTNPKLGGGNATFFSSADTGLASVAGLSPLTCTQPPLNWSVDQASSESGLPAPLPLLTQRMPSIDFGVKKEAVEWSWGTSQLGKNNITSGGSSSNQLPSSPLKADFADGLFTQTDYNKIMAEQRLEDLVRTDPKEVRRILRNRRSAAVSKEKRKMKESDLESKVEQLQQENKSLSARLHSQQSKIMCLTAEKKELMSELYGLRQQEMQLKNDTALNKTPNAEVRRVKLIAGEITGSHVSENSYQERIPQMMQPEHPRKHNRQLAQIQQEQELRDFHNFFMQ